jgi:hypothetical protein
VDIVVPGNAAPYGYQRQLRRDHSDHATAITSPGSDMLTTPAWPPDRERQRFTHHSFRLDAIRYMPVAAATHDVIPLIHAMTRRTSLRAAI